MSDAYLSRGASSGKEEVHAAVSDLSKGVFPGAFCSLFPDVCGNSDYVSTLHADGAGTKAALGYIKYKETGDLSAVSDLATDSVAMNIDDLLCIGATSGFIASNTIDRNAHRVGGDVISAVIRGYKNIIDMLASYGVDITMTGGETADVGDLASTLIINSTFFCRLRKKDVIDFSHLNIGDVIVGLSSTGKCDYEKKYNAGMGSNGLTAARHLVLSNYYADKYPETYSETIPKDMVYVGKHRLEDSLPGTDINVGDAVLSPTRTYAPVIKKILSDSEHEVHGIVHCTGGGQVKCKNFGNGVKYIKDSLFDIPPLFKMIYDSGEISVEEMYRVFNMGHRMEIYCPAQYAAKVVSCAESFGVEAKIIGRIEKADSSNEVEIHAFDGSIINYK